MFEFSLYPDQVTGILKHLLGALLLCLLSSGCVSIPDSHTTVGNRSGFPKANTNAACAEADFDLEPVPAGSDLSGLDPAGFSLLSWNSYKGNMDGWEEDLRLFAAEADLVLLQEGYLTDSLEQLLNEQKYNWDLATGFTYKDVRAGVLTGSKTVPDIVCTIRETEPLSRIPKTGLVTRYDLSGTGRKLLVVNLHMINFSGELASFRKQLAKMENVVSRHRGPVILAGDFNTWSMERQESVMVVAGSLGLNPLLDDDDLRTRFMGHAVDHIYYRELIPDRFRVESVSSSDHNPLLATFRYDQVHD